MKKLKKYKVSWLETKVIQRDVYTFVEASSAEEAVKQVKARPSKFAKDFTKTKYSAKYSGKVKLK